MKKILAIIMAAAFLLALVGCANSLMFDIEEDTLKFENAGYEIYVTTDSNEVRENLNQRLKGLVQMGDAITGTDLKMSDCRPLYDKLPEVCEKITGEANYTKKYENAPYESMIIFYFETPSDAERYVELFIPWFKIIQHQKASTKEYTYGQNGNMVYIGTIEAYDILMQSPND